ncbi:L-histidine N(alpha)-methyltransferase [Denitromonas iodatirespirans]|uniref:L-histidine N(Alpha)-methyltransferase n=1 Tax=Denitromonas iodatirespirans TaxID=2795389 RepID=A0A944D727_DENI1|nr:L-histidine N(alpha)-methyltransferase [Denitromonas iodatirespirans]MBT0959701.1 L-histidine N(alpha)-methyltransferase [Denitromonas iodatirespirans]
MTEPANFELHDLKPAVADFRREVLAGLAVSPRRIPPKFFYDAEGSQLFDAITCQPEYYPTRTEIGLLRAHGREIAERLGRQAALIELGSGSDIKIRSLLDVLRPAEYLPLDISLTHLRDSALGIARDYPQIRVRATCVDYTRQFALPPMSPEAHRVVFYPGSSVGNFEPDDVRDLLRWVAGMVGPGGRLLIGVDLKKDPARLNAAYNDAAGVTAAFNRNVLKRMVRELGAQLVIDDFVHRAFYHEALGRIEMHLQACRPTRIQVAGQIFDFAEGEGIHTENSYKYSPAQFAALAAEVGFVTEQVWCDAEQLFSVHCLRVAAGPS